MSDWTQLLASRPGIPRRAGSTQESRTRNERQGEGRSVIGRNREDHYVAKFAFDRNPGMPGSRPKSFALAHPAKPPEGLIASSGCE